MKVQFLKIIIVFLFSGLSYFSTTAYAQLSGAWEQIRTSDSGIVVQMMLMGEKYFSIATYKPMSGKFISTKGGKWQQDGSKIIFLYEFNTSDSTMVGKEETMSAALSDNKLQLNQVNWSKVIPIQESNLSGQFLFSGRKQDNQIVRRDTDQPRKTMKMLFGNRFQWIAYNTATGQFFGTGGGTYTARDGIYTEQIEFFSRNISRVGASLSFGYQLLDEDWHHTGKSSAGEEIYEIWSIRK